MTCTTVAELCSACLHRPACASLWASRQRPSLARLQAASPPESGRGAVLGAEREVPCVSRCGLGPHACAATAGEKPDSRSVGPFTPFAEKWNGRIAMLGFTGARRCLQITRHAAWLPHQEPLPSWCTGARPSPACLLRAQGPPANVLVRQCRSLLQACCWSRS